MPEPGSPRGGEDAQTSFPPRGPRLGVDVGKARVGLAASDPDGLIATPVRTLKRDAKRGYDRTLVVRQALERGVLAVYVGLPRNLGGADTPSTQDALDYAVALSEELAAADSPAVVRMVDERLTTVSAQRQLHQNGLDARASRAVIDQAAAVAILQQALDVERSQGRRAGHPLS